VFEVHCRFIVMMLVLMGLLTLSLPEDLVLPGRLPKAIMIGLALFWGFRLYIQWFVYDQELWRGKRFETTVHFLFSLLWIYLTSVFTIAAMQ